MKTRRAFRLFFAAGLMMLGIAGFLLAQTFLLMRQAETAEGTVVGYESRNADSDFPIVQFRTKSGAAGQFVSQSGGLPPPYYVGATVQILYDPNDPTRAQIRGVREQYLGPAAALLLGIGFTLPYLLSARAQRRAEWFQHNGLRVIANVTGVELNESFSVNEAHPYRMICRWKNPATGKEQVFRSDNLWSDPTAYVRDKQVGVFIDPANTERYWVDTSFLPNKDA